MLATISERNIKLENDFSVCLSQVQIQSNAIEEMQAREVISPADVQQIAAQNEEGFAKCKQELKEQIEKLQQELVDNSAVKVILASCEEKIGSLQKQISDLAETQ